MFSGREDIYISKWFAYDALRFLEDRDTPRRHLTTVSELKIVLKHSCTATEGTLHE